MMKLKQEWWMPINNGNDGDLNFLCDHLGDAQEIMEKMWKQICEDHQELEETGYNDNEGI